VGQKVNPVGLRIGIIRDWESKWYAGKDFGTLLMEDVKIREYLKGKLKDSAVSHIEIERAASRVNVTIHTAKPGMVIGKGGAEVEVLRSAVTAIAKGKKVHININEIKHPDWMQFLLLKASHKLERHVSFVWLKQPFRNHRSGAKKLKLNRRSSWRR
jgi:small subunit ribosomal protein S3